MVTAANDGTAVYGVDSAAETVTRRAAALPGPGSRVLGGPPDALIVEGQRPPVDRGTPERFVRVTKSGEVTETAQTSWGASNLGMLAFNSDRTQVAVDEIASGGACYSLSIVAIVDLHTGKVRERRLPAGEHPDALRSITWGNGPLRAVAAPLTCEYGKPVRPGTQYTWNPARVGTPLKVYDRQEGAVTATFTSSTTKEITNPVGELTITSPGQPPHVVSRAAQSVSVRPS